MFIDIYIYIYTFTCIYIITELYIYIYKFVCFFIQPVLGLQLTAHLRKGNSDAGANLRAEAEQMFGLYR